MRFIALLVVCLMAACPTVLNAEEAAAAAETVAEAVTETASQPPVIDYIWVLLAAALVFLMQAGFMCVESGIARNKNNINVAIKNMGDLVIAVCSFYLIGFGLMFGESVGGWFGFSEFAPEVSETTSWLGVFFVFQAMFVGTAATIDSGVIAERTRFGTYLIISFVTSCVVYPVFGHWAWGSLYLEDNGGWLADMGFLDFAGSTVVHATGAWVGLASAIVIGARLDKFDENGKPRKIQPSSLPLMYLGTFLLFFGWFGFNCGSTLAASTDVAGIAFNTVIAAAFGGLAAAALGWLFHESKTFEAEYMANGVLGGLVAITAGCDIMAAWSSAVLGLGAGVLVYFGTKFIEHILKVDDVVAAIPVHGFCGAWGTIGLAFFMPADALGDVTRGHQIGIQCLGVLANFGWAFGVTFVILYVVKKITPLRVPVEDEQIGLNVSEHGAMSSVLDLANAMHEATNSGHFDQSMKVAVEYGTEIGDLSQSFNALIDTVVAEQTKVSVQREENDRIMADIERQSLIQKKITEFQEREVQNLANVLRQISNGDVDCVYEVGVGDEDVQCVRTTFKTVEDAVRGTVGNLSALIGEMRERAEVMQGVASAVSDQASNGSSIATEAVADAHRAKDLMDRLNDAANEVNEVIELIHRVAEQTNLLALNATIEAASAGEAGRGFSVVANAIKELAERSGQATEDISNRVGSIQQDVSQASEAFGTLASVIDQLSSVSQKVADTIASSVNGNSASKITLAH